MIQERYDRKCKIQPVDVFCGFDYSLTRKQEKTVSNEEKVDISGNIISKGCFETITFTAVCYFKNSPLSVSPYLSITLTN